MADAYLLQDIAQYIKKEVCQFRCQEVIRSHLKRSDNSGYSLTRRRARRGTVSWEGILVAS